MTEIDPGDWNVSRETLTRLECLCRLIREWSQRINLVSKGDLDRLWPRHVADCLQLLEHLPERCSRLIDLGSGAGFPGLVLSISQNLHVALIEADGRKAAFLRHAAQQTGASVDIHAMRIEDCVIAPAPLLTARGLAPLADLLRHSRRFLTPDGTALFLKGRNWQAELTEARSEWQMTVDAIPSRTDPSAHILSIRDISQRIR